MIRETIPKLDLHIGKAVLHVSWLLCSGLLCRLFGGGNSRRTGLIPGHAVLQRERPHSHLWPLLPRSAMSPLSLGGDTSRSIAGADGLMAGRAAPLAPQGGPTTWSSRLGRPGGSRGTVCEPGEASGLPRPIEYGLQKSVDGASKAACPRRICPRFDTFRCLSCPLMLPRMTFANPVGRLLALKPWANFSAIRLLLARERCMNAPAFPWALSTRAGAASPIEAWMRADVLKDLPHQPGPKIDLKSFGCGFHRIALPRQRGEHQDDSQAGGRRGRWGEGTALLLRLMMIPLGSTGTCPGGRRLTTKSIGCAEGQLVGQRERPSRALLRPPRFYLHCVFFNWRAHSPQHRRICRFAIPPGALKPGENLLALRIADPWAPPFFDWKTGGVLPGINLKLDPCAAIQGLGGQRQRGTSPAPLRFAPDCAEPSLQWMIHPLLHASLTGVIWYQGENNGDHGFDYRRLFPAMICDWRNSVCPGGPSRSCSSSSPTSDNPAFLPRVQRLALGCARPNP